MTDTPSSKHFEAVAQTVHEAIRAWGAAHGQTDIPCWDEAPEWMHKSTRESVLHVLKNRGMDGRTQHHLWMEEKVRDGWRYGPSKSEETKTHPLLVPFDELPEVEKKKDELVIAIVGALNSN